MRWQRPLGETRMMSNMKDWCSHRNSQDEEYRDFSPDPTKGLEGYQEDNNVTGVRLRVYDVHGWRLRRSRLVTYARVLWFRTPTEGMWVQWWYR